MSTIADYSVFTKAFLTSTDVEFSKLSFPPLRQENSNRAFAVVPLALGTPLTPREAMNFDWAKLGGDLMWDRVSCRNANGEFIGNIVRVQPGVREGSIRLVAKVAVPAANEGDVADIKVNTFVLLRTDSVTSQDLPIAVATISDGYRLHKHHAIGNDPLDDVENANYVSFTINHLNGYTSVDFNPDAYVTYDVTDALSRSIDGLHIAFDTASGDLKLLDKDGNVLDQANLPIKADVIIADGEEGYKYVKTDVKQDIHAAKAWMPEGKTAWEYVPAVGYTRKHAALVVEKVSSRVFVPTKVENVSYPISTQDVEIRHVEIGGSTYMLADSTESTCNLFRVKGDAGSPTYYNVPFSENKVTIADVSTTETASHNVTTSNVKVDVITFENTLRVIGETDNSPENSRYRALSTDSEVHDYLFGAIETYGGSSTGGVLGITTDDINLYTFDENAGTPSEIHNISGNTVRWLDRKPLTEVPNHTLKYGLEAFVWTVKDRKVKLDEPFFQQLNNSLLDLGFHEGDDIALGTNLSILAPTNGASPLNKVDADKYMHGKDNKAIREREVNTQRANAKEELVAWNAQHPALDPDGWSGTRISSGGVDIRNGSITLGCGRVGDAETFNQINYGIQMGGSESLDFMVSHTTGEVQFDENGHATNLTKSAFLSIDPRGYISGAPTCLILAEVSRNESGRPEFYPVRMTTGFDCIHSYKESSGSMLKIDDYRENISAVLTPNRFEKVPAIIEVQAIYTHPNAETVPAQQMHTYIGEWTNISVEGAPVHPGCSFSCNKIEEWMAAVDLPLPKTDPGTGTLIEADVKLYVVIRVY